MREELHPKLTSRHLTRKAYLYVRQSSLQQVVNNTESTRRQYDLRKRALDLGWGEEQIIVVDSDQGQSGSTADRVGFQKLVAEVGMGRAGVVMGLEVSRLARNSADWHRLLEICALSETLILDEDGLYHPGHFNDRLLLGLKGTMSEAELHVLKTRLHGGLLNKARRGELRIPLPVGFVYDEQERVVLDPDQQVQETIRKLFATFCRVGSALGTAKAFHKEGLLFPHRRPVWGSRSRNLLSWRDLDVGTVLRMLQNPRYAGVYCFGKTRQYHGPEGRHIRQKRPAEDWLAWIPEAHTGYISQLEHEENLRRLHENAQAIGADRRTPPREGPALLQGLVVCGKCGRRMGVHYHQRLGELAPSYVCPRKVEQSCQSVHGRVVDDAVGRLLVELVSPMTLEVSLRVQQELGERLEETERLRRKQVERARYEAELARQRFLRVDPNNRLVAASLEIDWNEKLKLLAAAEEQFERRRASDRKLLGGEQTSKVMALANDFSRLWKDPQMPARERKRMVRLLLEDVTLSKQEDRRIVIHVRFKGGATHTLSPLSPPNACELFMTDKALVEEIDQLLEDHAESEIAALLSKRGVTSARNRPVTLSIVKGIRLGHQLRSRFQRLRRRGYLTGEELAAKLHVAAATVIRWKGSGLLKAHYYSDRLCVYEDPTHDSALPAEEVRNRLRAAFAELSNHSDSNEVQYET